jgi:serine/threonine-protein kinase
MIRREDPPLDVPGMSEVVLDTRGRLVTFLAVPPRMEAPQVWPAPDWRPLLEEAALDPASLRVVSPEWTSPVDSDRKAAWEGTYPGDPPMPVHIEAAAYHGRPVWFSVLPDWARETALLPPPPAPTPVGQNSLIVLALAMPLGGVLLTRRNLRLGRSDRKAAFRVALFVFVAYTGASLLRADHTATFAQELWILIKAFAYPAFWAAQVWLLYMALEPYARRRWPQMLISWKRMLAGHLRDPLVGRDVLLGAVAGSMAVLVVVLDVVVPDMFGKPSLLIPLLLDGAVLGSLRQAGFRVLVNVFSAVLYGMVFLFILTLLRMVCRRTWAAALLWCALMAAPLYGQNPAAEWVTGLLRSALLLAILLRGGLLALVVTLYVMFAAVEVPLTTDVTAWYAVQAMPVVGVILVLAVYGFYTSLGDRPAFGRVLED